MLAEIDLNVILHLGRFRNVDLPTRGIYYIEAALYCGCAPVTASSVQITPIGMFSAPQTLDSFVKRQTLFPAPMLDTSQITEETKKFRTRQIVIRYLEEIHELNDGVHWRLTTPNVRIRLEDCEAPICLDVLHLRLELFCCPLLRDEKLNIMTDIELLLPNPASFESVASQSIEFQRATTGIHQYYPIRFDKKHCVEVDAMVHACVTAIRYKGLPDLNPGRKENDRSSFSNEGRHTLLDSSSSEFQAPEEDGEVEDPYLLNEDLSPAAEYNASLSSPPLDGHSSQKALFRKKDCMREDQQDDYCAGGNMDEDDNPYEIRDEREEEDEHFGENGRHSTVSLPRSSRLSHTPPPKRQSFPQALHLSNSTADASSNSSKGYMTGRGKSALSFGSDEDKGGEAEEDPYALLEEIEGNRDDSFAVSDEDGRGHDARNKSESPPYRRNHLSFNDRIDGEEEAGADLSRKYEGDASSLVESSQPSTAFHTPMKRGVLYSSSLSSSISAHGKSPPLSLLTNDEELDRPAPPLQPQPVASSRFSVSPKFRAYTTVIQPSTPSPRTRGLRSSLSSFASAIRHSFSHEDINSVQPAKMNVIGSIGEPFRADGKQNAGLVSSYTQLLMFNWKALLAGCETLNLDQEVMMPEDGNIEEGYIEGGMLHDAAGFAEQLSKGEQWSGIVNGLMRLVRAANNQFLRRWMLLFASLRRCMPQSIRRLKPLYRADMHDFWKAQMILHTNCISDISHRVETAATDSSGTTIPNYSHSGPHQELSQLRNLIEMEQASSRDALSIDNGDATLPARELHLYDPAVHKDLLRLPVMAVQQSVETSLSYNDVALTPDVSVLHEAEPNDPRGSMFIGGEEVECDESSDGRGVEATVFAPNSVLRIDSEDYQNQQQRLSLTGDGVGSLGRAAISDGCWERTTKEGEKVPHLIILQHGYLGSVRDMSLLRNTLATLLHDEDYEDEGNGDLGKENKEDLIQVFIPRRNDFSDARISEENSKGGIEHMGAKLAEEILRYVQDRMPELIWSSYTGVKVGKISFICHSIGGLVARQALSDPMMAPLLPMMYTFISLSTPHLGTLFPESQVVSTGLWALNKLKSCLILNELMLKDTGNSSSSSASMSTAETEKCACRLAELAAGNSLSCFSKAIIAVSSLRDFYVPYYSTRMEVTHRVRTDAKRGPTVVKMAADILSQFDATKLVRITIDCGGDGDHSSSSLSSSSRIDAITGRLAHISYLDNAVLVEQLMCTLLPYLQ